MGETRGYRSELRERQAAQTRARIIEAAAELFAEFGYAATTLAKIAERAGVSLETVRNHSPKMSLLKAALEVTSFGAEGDHDILDLPPWSGLASVAAVADLPGFAADAVLATNRGSAGVWNALMNGAAGDADLADYRRGLLAAIRGNSERLVGLAKARGWTRPDRSFDELVESALVITSVETYTRIVLHDGWPEKRYATWVANAVRDLLLRRS